MIKFNVRRITRSKPLSIQRFCTCLFIVIVIVNIIILVRNRSYTGNKNLRTTEPDYYASVDPTEAPTKPTPYTTASIKKQYFLQHPGYKLVHRLIRPYAEVLEELHVYLNQMNELKNYFILVPPSTYHISLTFLTNNTSLRHKTFKTLGELKDFVTGNHIKVQSHVRDVLLLPEQEIRLKIEYPQDFIDKQIKPIQTQWTEKFSKLVLHHCTEFYLTMAYQYKEIPNQKIFDILYDQIKPFREITIPKIILGPIDLVAYNNSVTF